MQSLISSIQFTHLHKAPLAEPTNQRRLPCAIGPRKEKGLKKVIGEQF